MEHIPLFGSTLYHLLAYFLFYSFIGWCLEEAFVAADTGEIVNRGFLNGPVCPIYGCGALLVILLLSPISQNILLLYVGSVLLTSLLEYLGGLALEKIFHTRWWDYSNIPFNLQGHICLKFSLLWGLACLVLIKLVHPTVEKTLNLIPFTAGNAIILILGAVMIVDLIVTVISTLHMNRYLKELDRIAALLRASSNQLGTVISKEALELRERYDKLADAYHKSTARLIKAFPDMKSLHYNDILNEIKNKIRFVRHK